MIKKFENLKIPKFFRPEFKLTVKNLIFLLLFSFTYKMYTKKINNPVNSRNQRRNRRKGIGNPYIRPEKINYTQKRASRKERSHRRRAKYENDGQHIGAVLTNGIPPT